MSDRLLKAALAGTAILLSSMQVNAAASRAAATDSSAQATQPKFDDKLLTIAEAKARYRGPLSQVVLEFLSRMETTVNKDKATASAADWQPVGDLIDRSKFHRVGNFAEHMGWPGYEQLLVGWAKGNWWQGYIWRMSEVPAKGGKPGLVYVEALERSSSSGPVGRGGKEFALESISVYEVSRDGKIVGLHVYDHKPR